MPSAPSLQDIFRVEALVAAAARRRLEIGGFKNPFTIGKDESIPDEVTVVRFALDEATTRLVTRSVGGQLVTEPGEYTGRLEVDFFVERPANRRINVPDASGVARELDDCLARGRVLFLNHPSPFAGILPWWQVTALWPLATSYDLNPERELDSATLAWRLTLALLADALPAVP